MKDELRANFDVLLTEYPSGMRVNSMLAGKYFGISSDYIIVGNGAAELIKSLMERIKGNMGVVFPTFEEYPNRIDRSRLVTFIPNNPDLRYTADDLKEFFGDKEINTLLLINPDNPSGNFIHKEDVLGLAEWCQQREIRLIVDESFVDFTDVYATSSLLHNEILLQYPNMVVVKSISKSYGVPGLRLGVMASSDTELIATVKKDVSIWNINSFAEFYMQIFNKYEHFYKAACGKFIEERNRFAAELRKIKYLRVIPSQANYFLCEVIDRFTANELTEILLNRHNILIKDCNNKTGLQGMNYIRVAIRTSEDNDKLIKALQSL